MTQILHFTLGPVQSFFSQARRTRDLWAGSYLLSYLTGCAMAVVFKHPSCKLILPHIEKKLDGSSSDDLLNAILYPISANGNAPTVGSLPNHFKAKVPDDFDPVCCKDAVTAAWKTIHSHIWSTYVKSVVSEEDCERVKKIWDAQVNDFWDVVWTLGDDPGDGSDIHWLHYRKNWRTHHPPAETQAGVHCSVMSDFLELSGHKDADARAAFWKALRAKISEKHTKLELDPREKLSAIALIKRLYPRCAKEVLGYELKIEKWPSNTYMSAVDWLEKAMLDKPDACKIYYGKIKKQIHSYNPSGNARDIDKHIQSETGTTFAYFEQHDNKDIKENLLHKVDGGFFFESYLANPRSMFVEFKPDDANTKDKTTGELSTKRARQETSKALTELYKAVDSSPNPYYAVLLMDGDGMGNLFRKYHHLETKISETLNTFADAVNGIIKDQRGVLIYAGGDDVLAMLPVSHALCTAQKLYLKFHTVFKKLENDIAAEDLQKVALSGGLVFSHHRMTLRTVLDEARQQLFTVAKEVADRNSLAITVMTSSSQSLQWYGKWQKDGLLITQRIQNLIDEFRGNLYSSKFMYSAKETLDLLLDNGKLAEGISKEHLQTLLIQAYVQSRKAGFGEDKAYKQAKDTIPKLLDLCMPKDGQVNFDAALFIRFLAENQVRS